jgi:hypothetical protein
VHFVKVGRVVLRSAFCQGSKGSRILPSRDLLCSREGAAKLKRGCDE